MYHDPEWLAAEAAEDRAERAGARRTIYIGLVAATVLGLGVLAWSTMHDSSTRQRPHPPMIMTVTLPPPPPPPPPKPAEKPPEPLKQTEPKPTQMQEPKAAAPKPAPAKVAAAKPNPAPPGAPLTAAPGTGNNPYGLQAGNGGGDVIGGGAGEGGAEGGGVGFGFYAKVVQSQLQAALMRNEKTRHGTYSLGANLWLSASGRIDRVEITHSSGNSELDAALTDVLTRQTISEAPPAGMPQPIRTRIASRG